MERSQGAPGRTPVTDLVSDPVASSLFLAPDEVARALAPTLNAKTEPPKQEAAHLKTLTLDAILFQNPQAWTLWLNGIRISSETHQKDQEVLPGLSLMKVKANYVIVSLCQTGKAVKTMKLFPGKTYLLP
jgi:hypothetical protein